MQLPGLRGNLVGVLEQSTVSAEDDRRIAEADIRNSGDINHHLIHANPADLAGPPPMQNHPPLG